MDLHIIKLPLTLFLSLPSRSTTSHYTRYFQRDLRQQILIKKTSRDYRFCLMSRPATFFQNARTEQIDGYGKK